MLRVRPRLQVIDRAPGPEVHAQAETSSLARLPGRDMPTRTGEKRHLLARPSHRFRYDDAGEGRPPGSTPVFWTRAACVSSCDWLSERRVGRSIPHHPLRRSRERPTAAIQALSFSSAFARSTNLRDCHLFPSVLTAGLIAPSASLPSSQSSSTTPFGSSSRLIAPGGKCRARTSAHCAIAAAKPSAMRPRAASAVRDVTQPSQTSCVTFWSMPASAMTSA